MLPKIDIHVHLEGTITPTMMQTIAKRNGLSVPSDICGPNETYVWNDFMDFMRVFDLASGVLRTVEDYRDITYDYLARNAKEGVIYTELMVSPDHGQLCGLNYQDNMEGVIQGIEAAKEDFNMETRILVTCVRHFGVDSCMNVARLTQQYPSSYVTGFGIAGDEIGFPPALFTDVFRTAHDGGLQCTAHAGELVGPEGIWEAITHLPIKRIGHGVRSIEDPVLIQELIRRKIALEICPGSNIKLRVFPNFESHPLLKFWHDGVSFALGADDPPHFDTTIGKEYDHLQKRFGLTGEDCLTITRNGIEMSFIDDETKQCLLAKVEDYDAV